VSPVAQLVVEREKLDGDGAAVEDGSWWSCRTYQTLTGR